VSQDADLVEGEHGGEYFKLDDAARRAKGIPRVDKHLYARENGWMIAALADLYAVSGDASIWKKRSGRRNGCSKIARWMEADSGTMSMMWQGRIWAIRWRWGRRFLRFMK
jgi:hypothetical protein